MSRMCGRNQESRAGSVVCWPAHAHSLRERNEVSLRPFLPRRSASGLGTRRAEPPRHRCRSSRCGRLAPPAVSQAARPRALVSNSNAVVLVIRSGGVISVGCWPHGSCLAAHDHFSACLTALGAHSAPGSRGWSGIPLPRGRRQKHDRACCFRVSWHAHAHSWRRSPRGTPWRGCHRSPLTVRAC